MYKPDKSKITNFYNQFSNPSGKAPMPTTLGGFFGSKPTSLKEFVGMSKPTTQQPTMTVPTFAETMAKKDYTKYASSAPTPVSSAPAQTSGQLFTQPAPQEAPAPAASVPSQYMKEDGTQMTPEEYVEKVKGELRLRTGGGDIGSYASSQFMGGEKTAEQLANEARQMGNAKGDLASGETDPYGIASKSGIAYSPAELKAIENAAAGIYDPALTTAIGKLEAKKEADAEASKWEQELEKMKIQNGYDLEKMAKSFEYDKAIQGMKIASDKAATAGAISPYQDERSIRTIESIDDLMGDVSRWNTGWGSLLRGIPETDAKAFNTKLNTLKSSIAFGELTAMREASKTGGALGNVSNIELNLLENALAGLDSAQSPEDFKLQLTKAKDSINRWRQAQGASPLGVSQTQPATITQAPDGTLVEIID